MIQIFFSIYFVVVCYKRAKLNEKNVFLWPIAGAACFILISSVIPLAIAYFLNMTRMSRDASIIIYFGSVFVGLLVAYFVTSAAVDALLPAKAEERERSVDDDSLPELESNLISAVFAQNYDLVEKLLSEGADIYRTDSDGYTAEDYASAQRGKIWKLVKAHAKNLKS